MERCIFVTGGVMSSLGKGIAAASIGAILESSGFKIGLTKLDPYINIDPGTMSPYQHGEVFVTTDGTEVDLDIGHYERFTNFVAGKYNNCTTGQIYHKVIEKERKGSYLGNTVQVIPHITDTIKEAIEKGRGDSDISIIEIGGTVGDIESLPFIEAIRQYRLNPGVCCMYVHLTLVPFVRSTGELKTKPTQHSVKALQALGIQPDMLLCRCEYDIPDGHKQKIALLTNVSRDSVISAADKESIYEIPLCFYAQKVDKAILKSLGIHDSPKPKLKKWEDLVKRQKTPKDRVDIVLVGKYAGFNDAYKSIHEAFVHAGIHHQVEVRTRTLDPDLIEDFSETLEDVHGLMIPGGFGIRGIEGKIKASTHARNARLPFFGICLGMQVAVIEFTRHCLALKDANSMEFFPQTPHPVFHLLEKWEGPEGNVRSQTWDSHRGATMCLGDIKVSLKRGSLIEECYGVAEITERHRHRFELNEEYTEALCAQGMSMCGMSFLGGKTIVKAIELPGHPWFVGCQFHPEFISKPFQPHPLFVGFVQACMRYKQAGREKK